ncbi:ribonuclease H-like domain-containing protein [Mycena polygramma]|nr:ribonuclease H-like domain-containing protein [Mycena polygramma]
MDDNPVSEALQADVEYWDALKLDPVAAARKLVTACRASGQRRDAFEATIEAGNNAGGWGDPPAILRVVRLLKDVETHWSATFLMIDRVLEQYQEEIAHHSFDAVSLRVLQDIRRFLEVFHVVQEIVSAEKTPTLSIVLPMYEKLIIMLNDLAKDLDVISHAIKASVDKLEEYLSLSRRTKIYTLAMVLNPTIKLAWIRKHWNTGDYIAAKDSLRASMLEHRKAMRAHSVSQNHAPAIPATASRRVVQPPTTSYSARAQTSGLARFHTLSKSLSGSSSDFDSPAASVASAELTEAEKAEAERLAVLEDQHLVDEEMDRYEAEGVMDERHPEFENFDLRKEFVFHAVYRVALDILPVQASAVPCRISFTEGLVATEEQLSVIDVDPDVLDELLAKGKIGQLVELLNESWEVGG